jgi:cell division inhibitor SepF
VTPIKRAVVASEEDTQLRQITTVHPRSYSDAKVIGESFRDGIPVIMNVTDMGEAEAKRLVDFSAGLIFALRGNIERVTNKVFLLSPAGVEVLGEDLAGHEDDALFNQS